MKRCPSCQTVIREDDTICRACGTAQYQLQPHHLVGVRREASSERPGDGGATIFRDTGERPGLSSGEVIVLPAPARAPTGGRRGWLIVLGVVGAAMIVALTVLVTVVVRGGPTTTTTTSPPARPISDIRITSPPNGTKIDAKYPLVMKVAVDGDASKVTQMVVLVDGQPATATPGKDQDLVVAITAAGRHSVVAKATYDGGDLASKPIEIERVATSTPNPTATPTSVGPKPGTCGELCFHPTAPDVFQRLQPNTTATALPERAPATVRVTCQTPGGVYDAGAWWDKLDNGTFVADSYLDTPKPAPVNGIPRC